MEVGRPSLEVGLEGLEPPKPVIKKLFWLVYP